MKNIILKYYYLFGFIVCLSSCKDFIEVKQPINRITGDAVFQEDGTAIAAINGCYARLTTSSLYFANGGLSVFLGMYADDITTNLTVTNYRDFANSTLTASNSLISTNIWRNCYETIYQLNRCIQGLQGPNSLNQAMKNQLQGECYFLRAFCYWYLTNSFDAVPIITGTNYETNATLPRRDPSIVYTLMKEDLLKAKELLKPEYPSTGKFRANKFVATALLARLCLYEQQWQDAETYSTEVINSGLYSLPTPANAFLMASPEAIWQLTIDGQTSNTQEGTNFVPLASGNTLPLYPLTTSLRTAFETGDLRYTNWVGSKTVNGTPHYFPYKYKSRGTAVTAKVEQPIVLRLAEQYLIRAEARANRNNLINAVEDLKLIRGRAGLGTTTSTTNQNEVLTAIIKERRVEFFAEYGHRWFDLKRTGALDVTLNYKPEWQSTDRLLPIPQSEMLLNTNLTPNPGY